jgi:hypothetical protein
LVFLNKESAMADTPPHPQVDPERTTPHNAFDTPTGYSGQEYDRDRGAAQDASEADRRSPPSSADDRDIPPDAGHRATIAANGEVRGSGAGAGGGAAGEDYDEGSPGAAPEVPQAGAAPDRQ